MADETDRYRTWLVAGGAAQRTVGERLWAVRDLGKHADPHALTAEVVTAWVARVPAAWSRATYYAHAATWARYLTATARDGSWIAGVPKPRAGRGVPRPVDPKEFARAVEWADPKARTMLLLGAYAGLRVSEIAVVKGRDVIGASLYVHGKGGVTAMLPLHPILLAEARRYPRGLWFPGPTGKPVTRQTVWREMSTALRAVGSESVPHATRHLYGTALLNTGANLRTVQLLLRHASVATTEVYTLVSDDDRREAIDRLPVLASASH